MQLFLTLPKSNFEVTGLHTTHSVGWFDSETRLHCGALAGLCAAAPTVLGLSSVHYTPQ